MKIYDRKGFLNLPANTIYCKVLKGCQGLGDLEIKVSGPDDNWGNDWIADNLIMFMNSPFDVAGEFPELSDYFRFSEDQNQRDGLFEQDELYAVFDNHDIEQLIGKFKSCLK